MTADFAYRIIQFVSNKSQMGYINPAQFNLVINQSQYEFTNVLLGEFQQYQYGKGQPRVSYSENETVRNRLTPIIYGYVLNVDPYGFAPYMGDYQQMDAMWSIYGSANIYGTKRIRYVQQDALYSFYNSRIDPIATNPIYLLEDEGFRFYPNDIYQAKASYVRKPPSIVWAYTLDGNNRPVYDETNSINPVWHDVDMMDIIARALRKVGVNLQANEVSNYAEQVKNTGQ